MPHQPAISSMPWWLIRLTNEVRSSRGVQLSPTWASLACQISPSSVLRILAEHPIKPWHYQSWIFPRDPDFAAKATVILDLYQGYYQGRRLAPGDQIISVVIRGRKRPVRHGGRQADMADSRPVADGLSGVGPRRS